MTNARKGRNPAIRSLWGREDAGEALPRPHDEPHWPSSQDPGSVACTVASYIASTDTAGM